MGNLCKLSLRDSAVRGLNRQQYKSANHYMRSLSRLLNAAIDYDALQKAVMDIMLFGYVEIRTEDFLKY